MTRALALLAALLLAPLGAGAQMYKCANERGVVQYSDKPCPGGTKGGEVDIRGQPPISGKLMPYKEDLRRSESDFKRREQQREREYQAQERSLAAERKRCDNMREQLSRAAATRRPGNPEAHDAAIRKLTAELEKCR